MVGGWDQLGTGFLSPAQCGQKAELHVSCQGGQDLAPSSALPLLPLPQGLTLNYPTGVYCWKVLESTQERHKVPPPVELHPTVLRIFLNQHPGRQSSSNEPVMGISYPDHNTLSR